MGVYAITFRIEDVRSKLGSYDERYDSVVRAIRANCSGRYWDETTSFFLVQSDHDNSAQLARAVDEASLFDSERDLLVVINLSSKGYKVIGAYNDADIDRIMAER